MPKNYCIMQIWAESGKSALPICNYSQILYQFLTFTQNLKRSQIDTHCHYYYRNYNYQKAVIIIRNNPYKKKINIHFYVLESLNYLQRIKVDMVTDEFTPYLSVKI